MVEVLWERVGGVPGAWLQYSGPGVCWGARRHFGPVFFYSREELGLDAGSAVNSYRNKA